MTTLPTRIDPRSGSRLAAIGGALDEVMKHVVAKMLGDLRMKKMSNGKWEMRNGKPVNADSIQGSSFTGFQFPI